jgi:predicted ATPase/DNA-binding CsgD family transcriptional regulator/transcriptional regulator with XRE-family HTH domain
MSRRTLFSIWLQGQREKLGLSLDSLCERMGCTIEELRTIEAGRAMPGKEMAGRLADIFDVPEDERPAFILFASSDLDAETDFEASDLAGDETPWRHRETPPNNLPAQLTSFIGREGEVEKVAGLLRRPQTRLLTMTGPPGIGKTRLSQEVGARFLEDSLFEDGVFFVPLAPITETELVAGAMAQTLNVKETSGQSTLESLKEFMRERRMLLVMDNFEQIVPAGAVLADLLGACEGLKALVTSREALHIYGEQVFFVPPMELPRKDNMPTAETLEQCEATDLFMQRARAARPDFAVDDEGARTIGEICRRLDGLPLAIELAAARASILSPLGILSRLDNRLKLLTGGSRNLPPRQQTLRSAIDWSYDLLDEDEGRLFRHLSVFVGGCTLEAAEAVATYPPGAARPAMDLVSSLLDKSLLKQEEGAEGEPRFMMLETIREYGLERLAESGEEAAVRRAHALYMVQLAEDAEPHLTSAARAPWLARLDAELDNIRAALAWSQMEGGDAELGLRLAGALHWYWYFRSYITEGRRWLDTVLAKGDRTQPTVSLAKALLGAGRLAEHYLDDSAAIPLLEESIPIWTMEGDKKSLAYTLMWLVQSVGKQREGRKLHLVDEAIALFRQVDDKWGLASALDKSAVAAFVTQDYDRAMVLTEESLNLYRELNDKWYIAYELGQAGQVALYLRRYPEARAYLKDALAIDVEVGDKWNMAWLMRGLGNVAHLEGGLNEAVNYYEESRILYRQVLDKARMAAVTRSLGHVYQLQQSYSLALSAHREAIAIYREIGDAWGVRRGIASIASLAVVLHQYELSAILFAAAARPGEINLVTTSIVDYDHYLRHLEQTRAHLNHDRFETLLVKGSAMSLEEALGASHELKLPAPQAQIPTKTTQYPAGLSKREVELLRLAAVGLTNAQIAERLFLSIHTVRAHLYTIFSKIGVRTRAAAAHFASENGLI